MFFNFTAANYLYRPRGYLIVSIFSNISIILIFLIVSIFLFFMTGGNICSGITNTQWLNCFNHYPTKGQMMLDALISGKIIRDPSTKIGGSGKPYCNFLLSVPTGDEQPTVIAGIAFGDVAERIGRLKKGDALAVIGALKPSTWNDKTTGEAKTGLSVTVSACLSVYDVSKRRKKPDATQPPLVNGNKQHDFDDPIDF